MSLAWQEVAKFGKKTVASGLTSSRFGNISLLQGEKISITCTGSMLDELDQSNVVEVDLNCASDQDRTASSETCVHRAIYRSTSNKAVIHTHSPYAVALSLLEKDSYGSDRLAQAVSMALQGHKACIARGHGVFASGMTLTEAFTAASMAEHSSKVRYLVKAR